MHSRSEPAEVSDVLDTAEAGAKVLRGGGLRLAGFAVGSGVALGGMALVTRFLGPADFGDFQAVLALVTLVQVVTDLGMAPLGIREYTQRSGSDRERFMAVLLGLRVASTVVGIVVATVLGIVLGYNGTMVFGVALTGSGFVLGLMQGTLGIPLATQLRIGTLTALDLGRQIIQTGIYAALVLFGSGVLWFYAAAIPAQLVAVIGTAILVRGAISLRPSFDLKAWAALVRPSLTFALAVAAGQFYVYTALVIIELVSTPVETGLFAAGFRLYVVAIAVPGLLVATAFPVLARAARDDRTRLAYATQRLFETSVLLGGGALLVCVLGAKPMIELLAGPKYADAAPVLMILGVTLGIAFAVASWGFTLLSVHAHRAMIAANVVALAVSGVGVAVLASAHGAVGASVATVAAELTLAGGYIIGLAKSDRELRPVPGRAVRVVVAVALALGLTVWLPWPDVAVLAAGLTVYGLALLGLRAVPEEILVEIRGAIRTVVRR